MKNYLNNLKIKKGFYHKKIFFLLIGMFIFLLFFPIFSDPRYEQINIDTTGVDMTQSPAENFFEKKSEYEIKHQFIVERQTALLITSYYDGEYDDYFQKKFSVFNDILASQWNLEGAFVLQNEYRAGLIDDYDIIIFLKEDREKVPEILLRDLSRAEGKKIILSGYNHELINRIVGSNLKIEEAIFQDIEYKDVFFHDQNFNLFYDTAGLTANKNVSQFFALASNAISTEVFPLAFTFDNNRLSGKNATSTFLAMPFFIPAYYAVNNASIVFLDLIYEGLGEHAVIGEKKVLLRLEDVNVYTYYDTRKLRRVYNFLKNKNLPFHIAFIPKYLDPTAGRDLSADQGRRFYDLVSRMTGEGLGVLVQHGYTHQIGDSVSGIGFEFWDEETDAPLAFENEDFVLGRIELARKEMDRLGFPIPDIWETPHYAASKLADNIFNQEYPLRYEHIREVGALPFMAKINGTVYIPENLGFVSSDSDDFVFGQTIEDIEENLAYLSVFRNPVASIFWHPWRDRSELSYLFDLFSKEGYVFTSVYDLIDEVEPHPVHATLAGSRHDFAPSFSYSLGNSLIILIYAFFLLGCFFYLRTLFRLKRYRKVFDFFSMSIDELGQKIKSESKKLPYFLIFVPARNERLVIENTIRRLASLDYPKDFYRVVVIVDERELDDNVEILTKTVVEKVGKELNDGYGAKLIDCVEVPKWYSGQYGDFSENPQKSTKGRALNFTLQNIKTQEVWEKADMIGVLDADGRLHPNVLKEAAYNRTVYNSKVLQGPVLQVSNFKNVSLVGVAAGLELAIHHLTELPNNLIRSKRVQFLAGTNYFIDKDLIAEVGGWDQNALVEDAELALRVYVRAGVKAHWIGSPEIEQTPENFGIYLKQRRRWVRGHLDLIKTIREASIPFGDKASFFWKIFSSQFRFILDLGFPMLALTFLFMGMFLDLGRETALLSIVLLIFAFFIWDLYGHIYRLNSWYIDPHMKKSEKFIVSVKLFFFSPVLMFVQSIPRILALSDYVRSAPTKWYKTERTREKPTGLVN